MAQRLAAPSSSGGPPSATAGDGPRPALDPSSGDARRRRVPLALALPILVAALAASIWAAVSLGTVSVPLDKTIAVLAHHLVPGSGAGGFSPVQDQFVWEFRMPRVLLAAIVGAGLAVVGTVMQAVVRNPLADPYVLGVSPAPGSAPCWRSSCWTRRAARCATRRRSAEPCWRSASCSRSPASAVA